jgi:nitroimidazol reductase NimA-like FMN-containing flavoprotein (pyridoxamine 5'-phosphate oxidase superfamily)
MSTLLRELSPDECRRLIERGGIGRVGFGSPLGQQIIPVNFQVHEDSIVLRTTPYTELGRNGPGSRAAFEVEGLDPQGRAGWSVVAKGRLHAISVNAEVAAIRLSRDPRPWADGVRRLYLRLSWEELTGRRLEPSSLTAPLMGEREIWPGYQTSRGTAPRYRGGQPPRF